MTSLRPTMSQRAMTPFALGPGDGTSVENPVGGVTTFKAISEQSGGGLTVIEALSAPGEGPPLHVHREQDEFIYVLEGTFRVKLGNDLIEALPGSFVFIPRDTPHTWQNIGEAFSRLVASLIPAVETTIFDVLPDETWVYPGHGNDTTLGAERPHLPEWHARGW